MISIAVTLLVGLIGYWQTPKDGFVRYREGFMIVGMGWVLASFSACLLSAVGTCGSVIDAFFEAVSGVYYHRRYSTAECWKGPWILLWRAMTQWLAAWDPSSGSWLSSPAVGLGTFQIFKSESPGPIPGKLVPRMGRTAQILYTIYVVLTLARSRLTPREWIGSIPSPMP